MKSKSTKLVLTAMLCAFLLFSCASDIEMPPPPLPPDELSSSSEMPSSSSPVALSSSSSSGTTQSSSSLVPSSSSVPAYNYCVFIEEKICLLGPMTSCPSGGVLSNSCPYGSSSSTQPPSNSSSSFNLSSSSSVGSSGLCAGFVDGTTREHYGKSKAQFCDPRDGKKYVYVTIGEQVWMAENLNYETDGSKCYNNELAKCTTYGRLYNWITAMGISDSYNSSYYNPSASTKYKGVCPSSWHLPNNAEWTTLTDFVGGSSTAGTKLKAKSGWSGNGNGTDDYGFSALPGGDGGTGTYFHPAGYGGSWWSATEGNASNAYNRYTGYLDADISTASDDDKTELYSVRCLKD
jgi:uncharacterized protein (TIGR02145 family)